MPVPHSYYRRFWGSLISLYSAAAVHSHLKLAGCIFPNRALPVICLVCLPQSQDEKIKELQDALQEAKRQQQLQERKEADPEQTPRKSKRLAAATPAQNQELLQVKAKLEQCQAELQRTAEGEAFSPL